MSLNRRSPGPSLGTPRQALPMDSRQCRMDGALVAQRERTRRDRQAEVVEA